MILKIFLIASLILSNLIKINAQDLNTISGSGFNIATGPTPLNAPENTVILGMQDQWDANYKWQLVNAHNTDNYYLRRYVYGWGSYNKIWHSGNLLLENLLSKKPPLANSGSINNFNNGFTFAYATSGTPWNGALMSFGGFTNHYDCQLSSDYGPDGGKHISFRTKNGDNSTWNTWSEIWHSNNLNTDNVDFKCENLFSNGNLWARQIKIASTNPWPDFVFEKDYKNLSLSDLEIYIQDNHRLPDIPSAAQVEKEGINLGEMNAKLLQKIEELTLHLIEQNKRFNKQDKVNEELRQEINTLNNEKTNARVQEKSE